MKIQINSLEALERLIGGDNYSKYSEEEKLLINLGFKK